MILVTGGCGYIGSHCAVELLANGNDIIIIDNLSNSSRKTLKLIKKIVNKDFLYFKYDVKNKKHISKIFEQYNINTIFHFAGLKSISESFKMPFEYYSNNIDGTFNLLEASVKNNVSNFIFSSSATIYGNEHNLPWHEDLEVKIPDSPYAQSKLMCENLIESFSNTHKFLKAGILRYFNPVGSHSSGLIGDNINNSVNLFPSIVSYLIGKTRHLNVYGDNYDTADGTGIRDFIHINDLVKGHLKAMEYIKDNKNSARFHIWNLGSGKGTSVFQIINTFETILEKKFNIKIKPRRKGDLSEYWADIRKAKNQLNWKPQKTTKDIVLDTIRYSEFLNSK
tara:strand:- start:170 stop:1180 length:1011 start_codon:yes stop_codon:yes gene_type:complete